VTRLGTVLDLAYLRGLANAAGPGGAVMLNVDGVVALVDRLDQLEQVDYKHGPIVVGARCPRCHYAAPNMNGCARCNPGELAERLVAANETITELRDRVSWLENEKRELEEKVRDAK
jgi:hypothetical protein